MAPEISRNVSSKYILYPTSLSPLSSLLLSELLNTMSQIEKKIKNNTVRTLVDLSDLSDVGALRVLVVFDP
jgi:hypothetical protein